MPQATDLVVKNGASTPVDKTFTLISPAAGFGGQAEWYLKEGPISSVFPRFTALASRNGNQAQKLRLKLVIPSSYNDAVTGLTNVRSQWLFDAWITVPDDFPEASKADAAAYTANILKLQLIQLMLKDATPAT